MPSLFELCVVDVVLPSSQAPQRAKTLAIFHLWRKSANAMAMEAIKGHEGCRPTKGDGGREGEDVLVEHRHPLRQTG